MFDTLREIILESPATYVSVGGFLIGMIFGYVVFRTNFCTMGSISDILSFGDYRRFRAWLLAAVVAIAGAQFLHIMGAVDLSASMYLQPSISWVGNVLGGVLFGFGMVFAGGCVSRNLARIGGGDMGSLIVLIVTGIFAFMAIGGLLGPLRATITSIGQINLEAFEVSNQGLDAILTALAGTTGYTMKVLISGAFILAISFYCFSDQQFRSSKTHLIAGFGIGLCVVAGWVLTGLAFDELAETPAPPVSLTYVRPAGDALEYLTRFTAFGAPGFGVVTVFGAIAGSFLAAISMGRFKLTTFVDVKDTIRNLGGAALMGVGGVMALGCTVGQALTGFSTLAVGSMITFIFIIVGGVAGVKYMEWRIMSEV
ncbi:MAG: YeeE/YedE family protein [Hyphomicrobiales bacterium]